MRYRRLQYRAQSTAAGCLNSISRRSPNGRQLLYTRPHQATLLAPFCVTFAIRIADPNEPGVRSLIEALDAYQRSLYPEESNHLDSLAELSTTNVVFLCACSGEAAVACAAAKVREDSPRYGEIKRMYVEPAVRGQGLSRRLLQALETILLDHDVRIARLETGVHQPEALGLYERMGYRRRGPFGDYVDDPLSVFMEKHLREC